MNLNKYIIIITSILILFLGDNVLQYFGYMISTENAPSYQKLHPATIIIFLFSTYYISKRINFKYFYLTNRFNLYYLLFLFLLVLILSLTNLSGSFSFILNTLILPVLISILVKNEKSELNNFTKHLRTAIITFFIINASISIFEMFTKTNLFLPIKWDIDQRHYFRSSALHSHPLNNALIISIIMTYILSYNYKDIYKIAFYFLGLVSIICFGTRSSLLIWLTIFPIYYLITNNKKNIINKSINILMFIVSIAIVIYITIYTTFGTRLMEKAYFDNSANTRIEVFDIFSQNDFSSFFWGSSAEDMLKIGNNNDILVIENFWLIWMIRFGILFFIPMSIFFIYYLYNSLKYYSIKNKRFILISFILISSTNNSLAVNTSSISIFILSSFAFENIKTQKQNNKMQLT